MSRDSQHDSADQPVEQNSFDTKVVSRRKALGRLGTYVAPAMLALLTSEAHAATSLT
jgi:hypothetical protein